MSAGHLTSEDTAAAGVCAATAFIEDPLMEWLAGPDLGAGNAEKSSAGFFAPAVELGLARGHAYGVAGAAGFDAVSIWSPPGVPMMDEDEEVVFGGAFHGIYGDDGLMRLMALGELAGGRHPEVPHYYLFIVGAATPGKGAGAAVLAPVLAQCDAEGVVAYLESSNERNHGFYERLGFQMSWQERPEPGGPSITGMARQPRR